MKVRLIKDSEDIYPCLFEESILHDVRSNGDNYVGLFASRMGSFIVEVPIDRCEVIDEECHHSYSKAMNQPFPRLCVKCGKPENSKVKNEKMDSVIELNNTGSYEFFKVNTEEYRVYQWIDGDKITELKIDNPCHVSVNPKNGGHRVLDGKGISHYVVPGWKHLYWKAKEGQPHFVK